MKSIVVVTNKPTYDYTDDETSYSSFNTDFIRSGGFNNSEQNWLDSSSSLALLQEVDFERIAILAKLGQGGFASVHLVRVVQGPQHQKSSSSCDKIQQYSPFYAMKTISSPTKSLSSSSESHMAVLDFVNEAKTLSGLSHNNIISLHGSSTGLLSRNGINGETTPFLLLDVLDQTLDKYLANCRNNKENSLFTLNTGWTTKAERNIRLCDRLEICIPGILQGMKYLHGRGILHLDLKPSNIGFSASGTVKIFDFGLATRIHTRKNLLGKGRVMGTPRYLSPERFHDEGVYTTASDVYSFGILLWEICALNTPFGTRISLDQLRTKVVENNERPSLKRIWSPALKELLTECWDPIPSQRPTFESMDDAFESDILFDVKRQSSGDLNLQVALVAGG